MSFEENPTFYLGQNISIEDKVGADGSTYKTVLNAPNTSINDESETTENLTVTKTANFNNIAINGVGKGILDTDGVNLGQVNDIILVETTRSEAVESQILSSIDNISSTIQNMSTTLTSLISNNVSQNTSNLNTEIERASSAEKTISTNLNDEILRSKLAEEILSANLNTEAIRATSAERALVAQNVEINNRLDYLYLHFFKNAKMGKTPI